MFNRAMSLLQEGNVNDARQYLSLSLQYEPRAKTYYELGKLSLDDGIYWMSAEQIEAGLLLCADSTDCDLAELANNFYELKARLQPFLVEEARRVQAEKEFDEKMEHLVITGAAEQALRLAGLSEQSATLLPLAERATRLTLVNSCSATALGTRLGGIPLAPPGFDWPLADSGAPLSFLCQLDLATLQGFHAGSLLPANGLLSFFYDDDGWPGGSEPGIYSGWKVFFFPEVRDLCEPKVPRHYPRYREFEPFEVTFNDELTFPSHQSMDIENLDMTEAELEKYWLFCDHWHQTKRPVHHLFGHAQVIQSDWRTESLYLMSEADKKRILAATRSWRLLLQLDSADKAKMEWGDDGRLYFLIDEASLIVGDFSKVWVSMQCF